MAAYHVRLSSSTSTSTPPPPRASHPTSPLPSDPDLQLAVDEGDDDELPIEIDQELVALSSDDDDDGHDHRDTGRKKKGGKRGVGEEGRRKARFSLLELGRKSKGKYSQVTATVETRPASTAAPASISSSSSPSSSGSHASFSSSSPSALSSVRSCVTLFNCVLCAVLCLTLFVAGYIGWTIGHRGSSPYSLNRPRLLVISMDGFKPSYITDFFASTPNLRSLMSSGISASRLNPVFPSSTFPNHFSLVTGLYPPSHGIVANRMYNASSDEYFDVRSTAIESHWWLGEPVWCTAKKWGVSTAVLNWPGSSTVIEGRLPDIWAPYNNSIPDNDRIDRLLAWIDADACTLCMVYIATVDQVGHRYGPNSTEVGDAVAAVDAAVGRLLVGLRNRGLLDAVNVLVVSDHGMADVSSHDTPLTGQPQFLFIDDVYTGDDYTLVESGANAHVLPLNDSTKDKLFANLSSMPNATACWSVDLPPSLHYSGNALIQPILVRATQGFLITDRAHTYNESGAHGYDPSLPDMGAVMIAAGAGVRSSGVLLGEVQTVDVYAVMCALLGILPSKNEGDITQFIPHIRH